MIGFKSKRSNSRTYAELRDIAGGTERAIRQAWFRLGKDLKAEANTEILRKPKGGKVYYIRTKSGRRKRHVASAPGETHANITGKLRRSVSWVVHGSDSMEFGYGFSTTARNAPPPWVEYIEWHLDGSENRPSIGNAVRAVEDRTEDHFQKAMLREFKRSA